MLCEAESLQGAPRTSQSTVIDLEGLVGPPLRVFDESEGVFGCLDAE